MSSVIPKLIFSDFDGTFFNFKEVDNKIIRHIFKNNLVVLFVDKLLWKINALGIIGNSMTGLKLRFLLYSVLTLGIIKRQDIYSNYKNMYKNLAYKKYRRKLWIIKQLEKKEYTFIILTNNYFTCDIETEYIVYTSNKRKILKQYIPEYLIGDNFWDDYRNCPKGTKYVNVGRGLVSKFKNVSSIKNFYEIFKVID